jgi:hypothetical protein
MNAISFMSAETYETSQPALDNLEELARSLQKRIPDTEVTTLQVEWRRRAERVFSCPLFAANTHTQLIARNLVAELPYEDRSYNILYAPDVLEFMPYETAINWFREFIRISKDYVVLLCTDPLFSRQRPQAYWQRALCLAPRAVREMLANAEVSNPHHQWEMNCNELSRRKFIRHLQQFADIEQAFHLPEQPEYYCLVFRTST